MTIEITNREDFQAKISAFMDGNNALVEAGLEPSPALYKQMLDEFLNQFSATTPARATPMQAGHVVVCNLTGFIPGEFKGRLFETERDALLAINYWVLSSGIGKTSAYGTRKVTYFG